MGHFIEDVMTKTRSYEEEIISLLNLFQDETCQVDHSVYPISIEQYMEKSKNFLNWEFRGTYTSIYDMMESCRICDVFDSAKNTCFGMYITLDDYILVAEFLYNLIKYTSSSPYKDIKFHSLAIGKNIERSAEKYNLQIQCLNSGEYIIVHKDVAVDLAVDAMQDTRITDRMYEFGRAKNDNNIALKEDIIRSLYVSFFEKKRKMLSGNNQDELAKIIGYASDLIRHGTNKERYDAMSDEEKIKLLNLTFKLYVHAMILLDTKDIEKEIKPLLYN